MKKLLIVSLVVVTLFLFGCGFLELKPSIKLGCCNLKAKGYPLTPADAIVGTDCEMVGEVSENISRTVRINDCDFENLTTCNVTVYKIDGTMLTTKDADGADVPDYKMISVCSNRETQCIQSNCTAMVCGPFMYDPTPLPGFGDLMQSTEDMAEEGDPEGPPIKKGVTATQLFNSECRFFSMDTKLKRVFDNAKGSNMNIFRFGIGSSFVDYQHYKYLFPFSDLYANINPVIGGVKDRYVNYLLTPAEYELKKAGALPELPSTELVERDFCPSTLQSPFLGSQYGNVDLFPNYRSNETDESDNIIPEELNKNFYVNFLRFTYRQEIQTGMVNDPPTPAQYECEMASDCYSSYCNIQDYWRGVCQKVDGSWVECGCNPYAQKCRGVETHFDTATWSDAAKVGDLVTLYNDDPSTNAYLRIDKLKIKVRSVALNPDCDLSQTGGLDWVKFGATCWTTEGLGYANCGEITTTYNFNCAIDDTGAGSSSATCTKIEGGGIPCTWTQESNSVTCEGASGYEMSCIVEGASAKCGTGSGDGSVQACILQEGYGQGECESDEILSCSYNAGAGNVTCGEDPSKQCIVATPEFPNVYHCGAATITTATLECADVSDNPRGCGPVGTGVGADNKINIRNPNNFPIDIFFVEETNGYVGYSLLDKAEFLKSDFANACGPFVEGTDYVVVHADDSKDYEDNDVFCSTWGNNAYLRPEPVPPTYGAEKRNGCECHWYRGDDPAYWTVVENFILLKQHDGRIGNCIYNASTNMVQSKAYGWCEPASYLTFADEKFSNVSFESALNAQDSIKELKGILAELQANLTTLQGLLQDDPYNFIIQQNISITQNQITTKSTELQQLVIGLHDDFYYEKQGKYLKEGVQPILDFSEAPNDFVVLDAVLNNSGASIVITEKVSFNTAKNAQDQANAIQATEDINDKLEMFANNSPDLINLLYLKEKITNTKSGCPKCLIGIEVENGPMGSWGGLQRYARDNQTLQYLFANDFTNVFSDNIPTIGEITYNNTDIIAFNFYPSEFTSENASLCADPNRNQLLLGQLKELSGNIRWNWHRSPLVTNFEINTALACWQKVVDGDTGEVTSNPEYDFLSYLFLKQSQLAKTGLLGVVYENARNFENAAAHTYTDEYCTLQKASRQYRADKPMSIFTKVYTSENVTCTPCTNLDLSLGLCDKSCMNGEECTLPDELDPVVIGYKCPAKSLPDPCTLCNATSNMLNCTIEYSNGTTAILEYNTSDFTNHYADRIAAIPPPYKCCIEDETGNFTYAMETTAGTSIAPIIFPTTNDDPTQDCGMPDLDSLTSGMCALDIPIKNYKITCEVE